MKTEDEVKAHSIAFLRYYAEMDYEQALEWYIDFLEHRKEIMRPERQPTYGRNRPN